MQVKDLLPYISKFMAIEIHDNKGEHYFYKCQIPDNYLNASIEEEGIYGFDDLIQIFIKLEE